MPSLEEILAGDSPIPQDLPSPLTLPEPPKPAPPRQVFIDPALHREIIAQDLELMPSREDALAGCGSREDALADASRSIIQNTPRLNHPPLSLVESLFSPETDLLAPKTPIRCPAKPELHNAQLLATRKPQGLFHSVYCFTCCRGFYSNQLRRMMNLSTKSKG